MKMANLRIVVVVLLLPILTAACIKPKKPKARSYTGDLTAAQLLAKGETELKRKKWETGRNTLKLIEEFLPSSEEFPAAKLLLADSYFYSNRSSYPEAEVEYSSFLNYFPRHPQREYVMYRIALCRFATIMDGERDQSATHRALEAFDRMLQESPGTPYATDAREKVSQCWRRLAEHELAVGIFYVNSYQFAAAEARLKGMLETYPEHSDRERTYYYLGEALRRKHPGRELFERELRSYLDSINKKEDEVLNTQERKQWASIFEAAVKAELEKFATEARGFYMRLVESYPTSTWAGRARDRLLEMGKAQIAEELDT